MGKLKDNILSLLNSYQLKISSLNNDNDIIEETYNIIKKLNNILKDKTIFYLYTDGSSKGNPGEARIGVVCKDKENNNIFTISQKIGIATNNEAEYKAIIAGLEECIENSIKNIVLYSDSELVVKQLNKEYKVKNSSLKLLHQKVTKLLSSFDFFEIKYIPRELNKEADFYSKF